MSASLSVHQTLSAQPTRLVMQRVIEAANDGLPPPDQHRIMDPLCDVDPFRRTPAWPPGRKVRLAHSPHFSAFRPPFGLGQNVFCPLGSRPRVRGSLVNLTSWVVRTPLRPCPGSKAAPMRNGLRAEPDQGLQVFGPVRAPPSAVLVYQQGNPRTRFPWAASIKLPAATSLLRDAAAVLSFKPAANPSPETGMPAAEHPARQPRRSPQASCRHSRHDACLCSASAVAASPRS